MTETLHKEDYVAWLREQAAVLRAMKERRVNFPLDFELVAEELEAVGKELNASVASHLTNVLHHLLKLQFSPAKDPRRGWQVSVRNARYAIGKRITKAIRNEVEDELDEIYEIALRNARDDLKQHHEVEAARALPERCPYTLDQALDQEFWPEAMR